LKKNHGLAPDIVYLEITDTGRVQEHFPKHLWEGSSSSGNPDQKVVDALVSLMGRGLPVMVDQLHTNARYVQPQRFQYVGDSQQLAAVN
jgi:hypothetical protein